MTKPSSSPRGERAGKPGATWESWVEWQAETWEPEPDTATVPTPGSERNQQQPPPIPNRKTRRAIARAARRNR